MKKVMYTVLSLLPLAMCLSGCGSKGQNIKELAPYIYEVETYHELDYEYADKYYFDNNYNWGGGCSAITKVADDGHRLIGRNMDLNISENCSYIVRTDAGKYKTMGLSYTFRDMSPKYEDVKKNGISSKWSKLLPFFCDDVMNDAGFHIEINMRHGEYWPNGDDMFACSGTNEKAEKKVHMFELPRYLAENCATIEEAKEFVKTINIYSKEHYWNYCFIMADATGEAALLEFAFNEIYWFDEQDAIDRNFTWLNNSANPNLNCNYHAIAQTNFYINELGYVLQNTKSGLGRLQAMQNGIDDVHNKTDMFNLMNKVAYSNFYKPYDECKANNFDPRSEQLGEFTGGSFEIVMNDEYEDIIKKLMDEYSAPIRELSREQKRKDNEYWESTFTEVVDVDSKSIFVRFYEDNEQMYLLTFDGIDRISSI
ncbi:MAG: linear amide C-N hydrolase [Bacilli bacterium]|nr:linear amide C-N hydrolase [Bacilli bacterium]